MSDEDYFRDIKGVDALAEEAEDMLVEKLHTLSNNDDDTPGTTTASASVLESLDAIFSLVAKNKHLLDRFMSMQGLDTIIKVSNKHFDEPDVQSLVSTVFSAIVAKEYAKQFVENGGLNRSLEILESSLGTDIVFSFGGVLFLLMQNVADEHRMFVADQVYATLLSVLEHEHDNGIIFQSCTKILSCVLRSGLELEPELSERTTKCLMNGIVLHKHDKSAQESARSLLDLTAGHEQAQKMLIDVPNEGPFVPEDVVLELQMATISLCQQPPPIETISEIVATKSNKNTAFQGLMVSFKVIETFIATSKLKTHACWRFFRAAGKIFYHFLQGNEANTLHFVDNGGLDMCLEILMLAIPEKQLAMSFVGVLSQVYSNLSDHELASSSAARSFGAAHQIMSMHEEDDEVYIHVSSLMATAANHVDISNMNAELHGAAAHAVSYGLIIHRDNEVAQDRGRTALKSLVGEEAAMETIDFVEQHHRADSTCSGAA